jgi:hypothetical protein
MKIIVLKNGNFGKKPAIRLEFPFGFEPYKESVAIFIRFLGIKPLDEIDNEDF